MKFKIGQKVKVVKTLVKRQESFPYAAAQKDKIGKIIFAGIEDNHFGVDKIPEVDKCRICVEIGHMYGDNFWFYPEELEIIPSFWDKIKLFFGGK